jgi:Zn-finger nucleic acid-binding protein
MRCPREQSELAVRETEGHVGFLCPTCKGAWLPRKYLRSIEYMRVFSHAQFVADISEVANRGVQNLPCPSGCGHLLHARLHGATLEWCDVCQGAWLDRGEITDLLARYQLRENVPGVGQIVVEQTALSALASILFAFFS